MAIGTAQQTSIDSYNVAYDGGDITEPTAFPLGVKSGDMDLLSPNNGGKGLETKANYIELIITADQAGTGTVLVTGASEGGPEEVIADLNITASTVVETGSRRWIDTITTTPSNTVQDPIHLAGCSILVADSGNDRVCKFGFDAIGYRYLRFYPTLTTITNLKIYARYF